MLMRWTRPRFFHFRADGQELARRLPADLELDRFAGEAYVSLVSLHAHGPGPVSYEQLNVRTYAVGPRGERGIWLLETQVDRRLPAVGARLLGMPYHTERPLVSPLDAVAEDQARPVQPGLEEFLLERYVVFGHLVGDRVWSAQIAHAPWRVQPARARGDLRPRWAGIPVDADPVCAHVAADVQVILRGIHLLEHRDAEAHAPM
jgi:uncharacterized protein